jgi:hypothetical protein
MNWKEGDRVLVDKGKAYAREAVIIAVNRPIFSNGEITYTCDSGTALFTATASDFSEIKK